MMMKITKKIVMNYKKKKKRKMKRMSLMKKNLNNKMSEAI